MRKVGGGMTAAGLLAAWTAAVPALAQAGDPSAIEHVPLACAVRDRHPVVRARTEAPAARMQVHFRAPGEGPWYAIDMRTEEGAWTARLPRATRSSFEYRIARQEPALGTVTTATFTVPVVAEPGGCAEPSLSSVESQILVSVPEGAPLVPPVPAGFSPVGVLAFVEEARSPRSKLVLGAVVALPVAVGAFVVSAGSGNSEAKSEDLMIDPAFKFDGLQPSGGPLSLTATRLFWLVDVDHATRAPVFYSWTLELLAGSTPCANMGGFFQAAGAGGQQRNLTGTLRGTCPTPFHATGVRVTVSLGPRVLFQTTAPASFEVGP